MPSITNSEMPKPKNWQEFEDIVKDALNIRFHTTSFSKYGRGGQEQYGIDIYTDTGQWKVGIQCKLTMNFITEKTIENELMKVKGFHHELDYYYICTTSPRDRKIQDYVWKREESYKIELLFWDDIVYELSRNDEIFKRHFPYVHSKVNIENEFVEFWETVIRDIVYYDPQVDPIPIELLIKVEECLGNWNYYHQFDNLGENKEIINNLLIDLDRWLNYFDSGYVHPLKNAQYLKFHFSLIDTSAQNFLKKMRVEMPEIRRAIYSGFEVLNKMI